MHTDLNSPYDEHNNTLPGVDMQRQAIGSSQILLERDKLPEQFPIHLWESQSVRYKFYWNWFTGKALEVELGTTQDGKTIEKFPLRINFVRNASRKHAALLFGEIPDNPQPMVRTKISPLPSLFEPTQDNLDAKRKVGDFYGRIVDAIWEQSSGAAKMYESGIMSQFLGGAVFQLQWTPWREDLRFPIQVQRLVPDFVLPIWSKDDPFDLNECWIVYRIAAGTVQKEFGLNSTAPWVTYVEHWDKESHSITIDGEPLTAHYILPGGEKVEVSYDKAPNPFGFVPIVYIPRIREGDFYGSSFVPDVIGLMKEFNGRWADVGTIIQKTAHRKWLGRNIGGTPKMRQFDNGSYYSDLGMQNPAINNPPELWPEDSPNYSNVFMDNVSELFEQMLKEGNLTKVAYGYVDGTQRSGETLKSLFWPSTAIARAQRVNWGEGLSRLAKMMLMMLSIKGFTIEGRKIPMSFMRDFRILIDWLPILPKDRDQVINEINTLALSERPMMSPQHAMELRGDVDNPDEEIQRIYDHMKEVAKILSEAEKEIAEMETDAQMQLADKQAENQIKVAKETPTPKPSPGDNKS